KQAELGGATWLAAQVAGGFAALLRSAGYVEFFFSSRRRHTRFSRDWSSDVCSSDLFESRLKKMIANFVEIRTGLVPGGCPLMNRSEERRVGKSVDLGGRRIIKKKNE